MASSLALYRAILLFNGRTQDELLHYAGETILMFEIDCVAGNIDTDGSQNMIRVASVKI